MSIYESGIGPNVDAILVQGTRIVNGRIPKQVRDELKKGVKAGFIGILKKQGLKPEVIYSMNHPGIIAAKERQRAEFEYKVNIIKKCLA